MFNLWQSELERLGYINFAQILNLKDYGCPQNRARIFLVSVRVDDLNNLPKFYFPKPFPLTKVLKDVLEENVDEKYYLSDERLQGLLVSSESQTEKGNGFVFKPKTENDLIANAVTVRAGGAQN